MLSSKENSILKALEPQAESHGIEIVTIEVVGSRKAPVVRIYIDTPEGVSFQELTDAQEWIGAILDQMDPFPGAYTMEVSSPGIDRPLRTPEHFKRFEGEEAKVRVAEHIDGRGSFRGIIENADDEGVDIVVETGPVRIGYDNITRANVIGKVEF